LDVDNEKLAQLAEIVSKLKETQESKHTADTEELQSKIKETIVEIQNFDYYSAQENEDSSKKYTFFSLLLDLCYRTAVILSSEVRGNMTLC
jgi:hypothetical protein